MRVLLQKLRGVLKISLAWGAAWALVFSLFWIVTRIFRPEDIDAGEGWLRVATVLGGIGVLAGALFGVLLSLAEDRKAIARLRLIHGAAWGAVASAAFPVLSGRVDQVLVFCPLGSLLGISIVAITRRIERRPSRRSSGAGGAVSRHLWAAVRDTVNPGADLRT